MSALELKVYDIFKAKLGEQEATSVIEYFEEKTAKQFDIRKSELATKEDLIREVANLRVEMREIKSDMIKWMFIFWIGQLAAMFAFLKFFK